MNMENEYYKEIFLKKVFKKKNQLIIRPELGQVKESIHDLPKNITFGKSLQRDEEGAQALQNWQYHQHSQRQNKIQDYSKLNKICLKQGVSSAKQQAQFRKNKKIQQLHKEGQGHYDIRLPHLNHSYGIPAKPSTPVNQIIGNQYGNQEIIKLNNNYQQKLGSYEKVDFKKVNLLTPKQQPLRLVENDQEESNWQLSRFKKIPRRIDCYQDRSKSVQPY